MHVDCKLEPLGKEPSGSVCLVDQSAITEVPVTARDPPTPPPASGDSTTVTELISQSIYQVKRLFFLSMRNIHPFSFFGLSW